MSINPAECDRTTVYAGECRNFSDTEWVRFDSGRRRSPDARDGNTWLIDLGVGSVWTRDDKVRNLVPLVPEPDADALLYRAERAERERDAAIARAERYVRERDEADRRTAAAEADRDRWKLHHDRVDGQWAKAEREVTRLRGTGAVSRADIEKAILLRRWNTSGPDSQGFAIIHIPSAVDAVCETVGIEDEQAVDPVEQKARELYALAWPDDEDPDTNTDVWETCENIARHVLGQEAGR